MKNQKTHWKKSFNPDYIGAWSFGENEIKILTIDYVNIEEEITGQQGKKEIKGVIHFIGNEKPLILNVVNSKKISSIIGSPYIEDWQGKQIALKVENIKAFGEYMEAVRVIDIPKKPKFQLNEKMIEVINTRIEEGQKIEDVLNNIKKSYEVSPEIEKQILEGNF
jgi:hypothetical protein